MTAAVRILTAAALAAVSLFAQKFEFAHVQAARKAPGRAFMRMIPPRHGRFEIHGGSIVDLVRTAWGIDPERVLGGPSWVEMDRFDIVAKLPESSNTEERNEMLKALLADRFRLAVHEDRVPMPGLSLTTGKKPSMKPADGSGDTGCHIQQQNGAPQPGGIVLMARGGTDSAPITVGRDGIVEYACRNMTMDSFVQTLHGMFAAGVGKKPVVNNTGLEGKWNFHLRLSVLLNGAAMNGAERITIEDAVDRQLGLKLTAMAVPTPVIVIDSVERTPLPDPPGTAGALPPLKTPTAFDVATVRPSDPDARGGRMNWNANRFTASGIPLRNVILHAFRSANALQFNPAALAGLPAFAETTRYDVIATTSAEGASDPSGMSVMVRSLLEDRFKMKWHTEDRPMNAYSLVAVKPKMKKADPGSRTHCIRGSAPAGSPPGSTMLTCQNIAMGDFVDELLNSVPGNAWPVLDSTGLEGGWDFSLIWGLGPAPMLAAPPPEPGGTGRGALAQAPDPGGTLTIFEAIGKQLGLKLEMRKRPVPMVVIDHLEETPTAN
jgi:uncharacterized protein (TIGR03435 family)